MTLFPEQGLTDSHAMVVGDRLYLICGHDASWDSENWAMNEWRIHSSADLAHWRFECGTRPEDTFTDAEVEALHRSMPGVKLDFKPMTGPEREDALVKKLKL